MGFSSAFGGLNILKNLGEKGGINLKRSYRLYIVFLLILALLCVKLVVVYHCLGGIQLKNSCPCVRQSDSSLSKGPPHIFTHFYFCFYWSNRTHTLGVLYFVFFGYFGYLVFSIVYTGGIKVVKVNIAGFIKAHYIDFGKETIGNPLREEAKLIKYEAEKQHWASEKKASTFGIPALTVNFSHFRFLQCLLIVFVSI